MNEHRRSEDADGETLLPRARGRDEEDRRANASNVVRDDDDGVDDAGARAATTLATEDAREELEREMDHVVNGVGDAVESSGRGDDENDENDERAPEDAFERYLAPMYWFTVRDVKVHVSLWTVYIWGFLLALVLMFVAVTGTGIFLTVVGAAFLTAVVFLIFACVYGTMIAHEMAHIEVCRRFGGRVDEDKGIILWPFGALAFVHLDGLTLSQELAVTLAGPVSHAPMALFWFLMRMLKLPSGISEIPTFLFEVLFHVNIAMLIWHFLPCYPMDGSRVLACLVLLTRRVRVETAAWIVCIVSYVCTVLYIIFSVATGLSFTVRFGIKLDPIFGAFCLLATTHVVYLLRNGRVRDHPTFSRYEIAHDAYHAFDDASTPEVFL
jgi:hypothetical protein|tara:strand:+ start:102 stop:1247 length:1146 start_codon:yes stop_codon:yes gene_type:complete